MMQAALHGRLGQEPRRVETKTGTTMAVASIAVQVDQDADAPPLWLGLCAFGRQADDLLRHQKGDIVSASGRIQRRTWTDRQTGETREQLQVTADSLVSARTARPGGGRKKQPSQGGPRRDDRRGAEGGLDDDLPF